MTFGNDVGTVTRRFQPFAVFIAVRTFAVTGVLEWRTINELTEQVVSVLMPGGLTQTAIDLVIQYGYLAIFVFMFLETSMLFPFLPSEVVVPTAAALLVSDPFTLGGFAVAATAGTIVGSLFAYSVIGVGGQYALGRYGRYVHVSEDDLERSQRWFRRWGESSVLWGRLLPVLRSVISIPAGFAGMNPTKFTLYTALGGLVFNAAVGATVYYGMQQPIYQVAVAEAQRWLAVLVRLAA